LKALIQSFKNLKFRSKLLLSYIVVIIIPILILGLYSYKQSEKLLLQQANQGLRDSIIQIADNLSYKLNRYNNVADNIAYNKGVMTAFNEVYYNNYDIYYNLTNVIVPFFNTLQFINQDIKKFTVYTGTNIESYGDIVIPIKDAKLQPWYEEAMRSLVLTWYRNGDNLFGVRRLVNLGGESKNNILYIEVDYYDIFNSFDNILSNEYGVFVVDSKRNILYSYDDIKNKKSAIDKNSIMSLKKNNYYLNGVNYSVIKYTMDTENLIVYFYRPLNLVSIDASNITRATILIILICLAILILIIWIFTQTFVNRIDKLNRKLKLVEDGDLSIKVYSNTKDEIGMLTNSFARMLKKINELISEVYLSEIVQKGAEMKALQAQINPHFLYNSLSLINWKAISIDNLEISEIVTALSKFYRTTLNKGKNIISIRDEIENTKAYIQIQSIMHDYSFDIVYDIDEDIFCYYMINIIFQPIVENAIIHGIDCKTEGRGSLKITGHFNADNIEFMVVDNGCGMTEETAKKILVTTSNGYGLKNVQDRIKLLFGDEYGIYIESIVDKGTKVKIIIPKLSSSTTDL